MNSKTLHLETELQFKTSRSGGAGGQNVNKVSTKVEIVFAINESSILTQDQKEVLLIKLANKLTNEFKLRLVSQTERTQLGNKRKVLEKFYALIDASFIFAKLRKPTKVPKGVVQKRLKDKKIAGDLKKSRKIDFER